MAVYYALIHVSDDGRHSFVYGNHDLEAVDDRFIDFRDTHGPQWVYDNVNEVLVMSRGAGKLKIVKLPAENLLAAYLDQQMAAYLDQKNAGIDTAPAKPIAPAGTLVGTVPSAYPYLDAEGWDAAARHKLQFDTVTAEGIAAIPHVELTANQIRYAGDIGAIHVDRRSIPHRYRFSDVMEYAAARDAGDKPATVAERHAKAAQ